MREESIEYLRICPGGVLPKREPRPCRVVVVAEQQVSELWQDQVSDWIVEFGCLYMMAWGPDCSSWDDSVDGAMLSRFEGVEIPDDQFVQTTWHEEESLKETFGYCHYCAHDPTKDLPFVVILHIGSEDRCEEMLQLYQEGVVDWGSDEPEPTQQNFLTRQFNRLIKRP